MCSEINNTGLLDRLYYNLRRRVVDKPKTPRKQKRKGITLKEKELMRVELAIKHKTEFYSRLASDPLFTRGQTELMCASQIIYYRFPQIHSR
jgi:hypothetical protein